MNKLRIAKVLREAAEQLDHPLDEQPGSLRTYICHIFCTRRKLDWTLLDYETPDTWPEVKFLRSLGMDTGGGGFVNAQWPGGGCQYSFSYQEQQEVRYAWLMFVADLIEAGDL